MRIKILKTNRRIKESLYLTACKEQDGLLGNIELKTMTTFDSIVSDFYVDPGSNVKMWYGIADELNKPGVFDKLARLLGGKR
jgi:hypothetical protein